MSSNFQKKTSGIFVTLFIGLIVISFMFTGYEGDGGGTPDTVATVGSHMIKASEYQREFQRQTQFYKNIFGGKDLTTKQIENFKIKDATINNIVDRKLILSLADEIGYVAAPNAIKKEIKKQPYFLTNNKFDLNKYKNILAANRISTTEFESDMVRAVKGTAAQSLLQNFPISDSYVKDILKFKSRKIEFYGMKIERGTMQRNVTVSNSEVKSYLLKEENLNRVKAKFKDDSPRLGKAEQINARHILLTTQGKKGSDVLARIKKIAKEVTPKNFSRLAKKYTDEPSGKKTGGNLKWFSRGSMVKEFESAAFSQKVGTISKPIKTQFGYHLIYVKNKKAAVPAKFDNFKNDIAKDIIRKSKREELDSMIKVLSEAVKTNFKIKKFNRVKKLAKKYGLKLVEKKTLNQLEGTQELKLEASDIATIFSKGTSNENVFVFNSPTGPTVLFSQKIISKEADLKKEFKDKFKDEKNGLSVAWGNKFSREVIARMREDVTVKVFHSRIR